MKKCNNCYKIKNLDEFGNNKRRKDGRELTCKLCLKERYKERVLRNKDNKAAYDLVYRKANKLKIAEYAKKFVHANKLEVAAYQKQYSINNKSAKQEYDKNYYLSNKESKAEYLKGWHIKNPGKKEAYDRQRMLAKMHRTPGWLTEDDYWLIEQFYIHAKEQYKLTGIRFHVDHIIPLQGEMVSGLHCPTNLQVIPWFENLQKSNKFNNKEK